MPKQNKTHQNNLETIRQACIKANPEIVELKFGCGVEMGDTFKGDFVGRNFAGNLILYSDFVHGTVTVKEKNIVKILGREIRLFDCSKIVKDKHHLIDIWQDGDLENQPKEVIDWIINNMVDL